MRSSTECRSLVATIALLMLMAPLTAAEASRDLPIVDARVETEGPVDAAALIEVLGLEIGKPIDRRLLREAIQTLYASGEVERVRVEATEVDDGLEVVVRLSLLATISKIDVRSLNPVVVSKVRKWFEVVRGDPASLARIEAGRRRILRKLQARGYARASVDLYLDYNRRLNSVAVTVELAPGKPQQVGSVTVTGVPDPEHAMAVLPELKEGARLTARLEERIRRHTEAGLRGLGYWEARVLGVERQVDGTTVDLELRTEPGASYRLELNAPEESEKAVRAAIPDPAEEELHPAQTAALVERIRENLQLEGFLLAEVTAELDSRGAVHTLRLDARPGSTLRVGEVQFPGAQGISENALRSAVRVRPGPTRGLRGRPLSSATLEADRRSLEELYRSFGFVEAEVASPVIEPAAEGRVRVLFPVTEGRRWILTDLRIEGLPVEAAAALEQTELAMKEAAPWNPRAVESTRRQLELLLADNGYPDGRVEAEVDTSVPGRAEVDFRIEPGAFVEIGEVVIAGLRKTRRSIVEGTLRRAGVVSGAPFARDRMLEAQRRLYELALFRRVELIAMPGQEYRAVRGLVVAIEEGAQRSYLLGFGWNETDRFRVTVGWSHLNLFGGAHAFSAEARLSGREQRFQVGLREPRLPKLDVPGYLVVYRTFEEFATYSQLRRGLWFDVGDRRKIPFRTWYRYEYQIVKPDAPDDILSDLERQDQEARISSVTPTLEWDYRDAPLVPTRGTYSEVSLEYAFPLFQANSRYWKLRARSTIYGRHSHGTWAAGIRLGAIRPIAANDTQPSNLQVPLNSRFFAGGASTHRAFRTDFLGITGQTLDEDGNPIGGNALVLLNFEFVRPVTRLIAGVLFVDVGNVWAEPQLVRLEDFRWGAGLGVRVNTPAGPLRAEYGWKLDREEGESGGHFFLSFGTPF